MPVKMSKILGKETLETVMNSICVLGMLQVCQGRKLRLTQLYSRR